MNAKITYQLVYIPDPWDEKRRAEGCQLWALLEVTTPEIGPASYKPVSIFNANSEAERFGRHVFASGYDGVLIDIGDEFRRLFQAEMRLRAKEAK